MDSRGVNHATLHCIQCLYVAAIDCRRVYACVASVSQMWNKKKIRSTYVVLLFSHVAYQSPRHVNPWWVCAWWASVCSQAHGTLILGNKIMENSDLVFVWLFSVKMHFYTRMYDVWYTPHCLLVAPCMWCVCYVCLLGIVPLYVCT